MCEMKHLLNKRRQGHIFSPVLQQVLHCLHSGRRHCRLLWTSDVTAQRAFLLAVRQRLVAVGATYVGRVGIIGRMWGLAAWRGGRRAETHRRLYDEEPSVRSRRTHPTPWSRPWAGPVCGPWRQRSPGSWRTSRAGSCTGKKTRWHHAGWALQPWHHIATPGSLSDVCN